MAQSSASERVHALLMLLVLVPLLFGLWTMIRGIKAHRWPTTVGVIEESRLREEAGSEGEILWCAEVRYRYAVDGTVFRGDQIAIMDTCASSTLWPKRTLRRYPVGKRVRVFYNPRDPSEAMLEPGISGWSWLLIAIGLLGFWVVAPQKRRQGKLPDQAPAPSYEGTIRAAVVFSACWLALVWPMLLRAADIASAHAWLEIFTLLLPALVYLIAAIFAAHRPRALRHISARWPLLPIAVVIGALELFWRSDAWLLAWSRQLHSWGIDPLRWPVSAAIAVATGSLPVLMFLVLLGYLIRKGEQTRRWPSTLGVIEASTVQTSQDAEGNTLYSPYVLYRYEVNGQVFHADAITIGSSVESSFRSWAERTVRRYPKGKQVKVYYSPEDPKQAVLEPGVPLWVWAFAFFVLALVSFLGAMLLRSALP